MRPPVRDGLVGESQAQRAEIRRRIEALRDLKEGLGRPDEVENLRPAISRVVQALDGDSGAPLKRCTRCGCRLPATTDYFYAQPRRRPTDKSLLRAACKLCACREGCRYYHRPEVKRRILGDERRKEQMRINARGRRAREKAAGLARPETLLERLLHSRREARYRAGKMTDPKARARTMARIHDLTHEIERLRTKEAE